MKLEEVKNIQLPENILKKMQAFFDNFEIKEIDENTISLCCNKNLLVAVNGNYMELVKGQNVKVGSPIHLNPVGLKYDSDIDISINKLKTRTSDGRSGHHNSITKYRKSQEI